MTEIDPKTQQELSQLAVMLDEDIDTCDIPEISATEWQMRGEEWKFYRSNEKTDSTI